MADKLVTVFELDVSDYLEQLRVLNIQIQQARDNQKELAKAAADGNKEAGIALQEVTTFLKIQQKEYASLQRSLVGFTTANQKSIDQLDFSNNSIKQNRALLSQLTEQYNSMDKVGREKVAPTIKKISDELKKQEGAIGDTRRNVGNYKESFQDAFSSIVSGIPALGAFATAQKGVNLAMEANPIGAVIALLTGLFQIFSQNKVIADEVSFAISGITKVINKLADDGVRIGKQLFEIFSNPKKAIIDLVEIIETNLTNRFKAFGVIAKAISEGDLKAVANGFIQLGTGITDATDKFGKGIKAVNDYRKGLANVYSEGSGAARALDELTVANANLNAKIEIGREKADALTKSLKDRTKSEQERIKIANQIADLEINNANDIVKLRGEELKVLQLRNKGLQLSGEQQAEVIKKQGELEVAALQAKTAAAQRQTRINILLDKQAKESSDKKIKIQQIELKRLEETFNKEDELKRKAYEDETERELNAQVKREEILAKRIGTVNALVDAELVARKRLLQNEKLTETERQNIILESEERIRQIRQKTTTEFEKGVLTFSDTTKQIIQGVIDVGQGLTSTIGEILNTISDSAIQNLEYQYQSGEISAKKFNALVAEQKRKAWKQSQALSITQTIFNTASAVMAQLSNPTPYVGIVLAALAAATGAAQIALIAKQKPPQFAKGGAIQIGGKSHSEGGTPIHVGGKLVAEAERGENMYILKKEASAQINALSAFNQMFGGRSFGAAPTKFAAEGGQINTGDGGFFTRSVKSNNEISALRKAFIDGAQSLPAPVVSVKEIDRVNTNKNRAVAVSEL